MKQTAVILKNLHGNSSTDVKYHAKRSMMTGWRKAEKFSKTACV